MNTAASVDENRSCSGPPPGALWRNKDYVRWFLGDVLGDLGSSMRGFAVPLVALAISGSATASGVIGTVTRLAHLGGLIPAGIIADRHDRKKLIVVGHLIRAAVFSTVAAAWFLGALSIWVLGAAAACSGIMSGVFGLASDSAVKHVVADDQLPAAAAANQARSSAIELASSPLSGLLMSVSTALPFIGEAVMHTLGAACAARIRTPMTPRTPQDPPPRTSVREGLGSGWVFLGRNRTLLILVLACAVGSTSLAGFTLSLTLSWRAQGLSTSTIGLLLMTSSAATVVGSILAPRVTARLTGGMVLVGGELVHAVLLLACALAPSAPLQAALFGTAGLVLPIWNAVASGYTMRLIPSDRMGRVMSAIQVTNMTLPVSAPILAGVGLDVIGAAPTLLAFAALEAATILLLASHSDLRRLGRPGQWKEAQAEGSITTPVGSSAPGPAGAGGPAGPGARLRPGPDGSRPG